MVIEGLFKRCYKGVNLVWKQDTSKRYPLEVGLSLVVITNTDQVLAKPALPDYQGALNKL